MARKQVARAATLKEETGEPLPELVLDGEFKNPQPLSRQVASAWLRTPTNDPSDGYDLLVNAAFGSDWITLKAGQFHIDALCSISQSTIEFEFTRCTPIIVANDEEQEAGRTTVTERQNVRTKTTIGGGLDATASPSGIKGKVRTAAKFEKTETANVASTRQLPPYRPFYRNGSNSVLIGNLESQLGGLVMTDWHAFRVVPNKGVTSSVAANLKVKQRSIKFHDIKIMSAPNRFLEPLRLLLTSEERKRKRAFEILLAHLAQSALANYQDGASATISHHRLVFKPFEAYPLSVEPCSERKVIEIDEVAVEGYLKVEKGREASALHALGVDSEVIRGIDGGSEKTPRTRGAYFIPESSPLHALDSLKELLSTEVASLDDLKQQKGLCDLKGLRLVLAERGTDEFRLVDTPISNADLMLRLAVAKSDCISIARVVLTLNPLATGIEIGEAVSRELDLGWSVESTLKRNGNAILRWMLWLEPYVVGSTFGNKAGQIAFAIENKVGRGRPDAHRKSMEKELRRLVNERKTNVEIAGLFGVSINTVAGWKRHYKISKPRGKRTKK